MRRKYKKAIIKEWLCDMSELFRPLPMGVTASYNTIGFLSDRGDGKILNRAVARS